MKSYKNISISLIFVLALSFIGIFFNSCNKYEEGPSISLVSATKRITGTWLLKETMLNDTVINLNDLTSLLGDMDLDSLAGDSPIPLGDVQVTEVKVTFEKDGDGNFYFALDLGFFPITRTEYITWKFDDEKENIDVTLLEDVHTFKIVMLTKKELWLRRTETTDGATSVLLMKLDKEND